MTTTEKFVVGLLAIMVIILAVAIFHYV